MVSVVIATEPADEGLATCLASLARINYPPERHEIILVSASERDPIRLPPGSRARHVRARQQGIAYARNAGIASARGSLVAFTDPDCTAATSWLKELVSPFGDEGVGAVAGAIVPAPPASDAERYAARRLSHSQLRPLSHSAWPFAMTPNLAFRRRALVRAGMFDTSFPGGGWEDADLCWRFARATELELAYAPRAVVFHRYRATAREFLVQHYRYGYGLGLVSRKHAAELGNDWLKRTRRYDSLPRVALSWLSAELRRVRGRRVELLTPRFDLLRLLGQRAGVLRARLRGP
jgi:GT2 family glycosyltransferase